MFLPFCFPFTIVPSTAEWNSMSTRTRTFQQPEQCCRAQISRRSTGQRTSKARGITITTWTVELRQKRLLSFYNIGCVLKWNREWMATMTGRARINRWRSCRLDGRRHWYNEVAWRVEPAAPHDWGRPVTLRSYRRVIIKLHVHINL